jgi:hypothetical protein
MAKAMVPIWTTTLTSTASEVNISEIPTTYHDLRLIVNAKASSEINIGIQINGDTGANYSQVNMRGYSTSSTGYSSGNAGGISSNYNTGNTANNWAINEYDFLNYKSGAMHKPIIIKAGHSGEIDILSGRWASTSAIQSIKVTSGGTFAIGSTFTLYGILG